MFALKNHNIRLLDAVAGSRVYNKSISDKKHLREGKKRI
jgi:hypothetical protein